MNPDRPTSGLHEAGSVARGLKSPPSSTDISLGALFWWATLSPSLPPSLLFPSSDYCFFVLFFVLALSLSLSLIYPSLSLVLFFPSLSLSLSFSLVLRSPPTNMVSTVAQNQPLPSARASARASRRGSNSSSSTPWIRSADPSRRCSPFELDGGAWKNRGIPRLTS